VDKALQQDLIRYLTGFITDNKRDKYEEVLALRTRYITVVLEDIFQPHNASAVMRSCDLFGVQDIHVIENTNRFTVNPGVTVGSSKWLSLNRYNQRDADNTTACLSQLRARGYRIVATTPHRQDCLLHDLPVDKPFALLFGTEETGLSETALNLADEFVRIPQVGFTESFNISVSVALTLYDTTQRLRQSGLPIGLSEEEKAEIRLAWLRKSIRRSKMLEERFFEERGDVV